MTLQFDILIGVQWFTCSFETESKKVNRLMEVIYDDLPIDVPELRCSKESHLRGIFKLIVYKMEVESHNYWSSQKVDLGKSADKFFHTINKAGEDYLTRFSG